MLFVSISAPSLSYAREHCELLDVPALVVLIISRLPSLNVLVNMLHSFRTARMRQNVAGALDVRPGPAQTKQASRGRGRGVELQCRDDLTDAAYLFSYLNALKAHAQNARTHKHTSTQVQMSCINTNSPRYAHIRGMESTKKHMD